MGADDKRNFWKKSKQRGFFMVRPRAAQPRSVVHAHAGLLEIAFNSVGTAYLLMVSIYTSEAYLVQK